MKAHPKFRPDMNTYDTSYNDINVGDIWYANFPFDDKEYVDENKISDAGKDRVCVVIEKRNKNDPYPFTVVKCTTKVDKVPKEYRVEVPLMSECVDCRKLAMLKPYHFRRKHFYMLNNSKFNEVRRKIKLASDNDELSNVILEDSALMLLCDDSIEDQVLYEIAIFLGRINIIDESKLKASERTDFGIPSKKAYPMPDEAHVRAAIRMFNHCDPEDEAELARNIKKYMKKYGIEDVEVSEKNRFSKYYKKPVKESGLNMNDKIISALESATKMPVLNKLDNEKLNNMSFEEKRRRSKVPKELWDEYEPELRAYDQVIKESSNKKYHTYEDAKFVFDSLTEQEQYWVAPHGYKNVPCFYRKCAYDLNKNNPVGFVDIYRVNQKDLDDPNTNVAKVIIAVSEPFRGKGIARALIKKAVHRFKDSDIDILRYNVVDGNDASIEFAKKVGFLYDFHSKKHGITSFLISNGNKMQDAIGESAKIEEEEEDNSVYFEEYAEDPADIAREIESMIQEMAGGGGPMVGMEINDQSVTTYNPGMFIISYGSKRVGKYDDDDGRSSGYAVANDFCSKYIYVKKNGKAVREEGLPFLRDRKISIYEFVGDKDKWFNLLKAIDKGTCDGEFYTALTGRTLYTDDQIYFDEHFKYYNPIKRRLDNNMTFNINEEFSLVEGKEWLLPVMDSEMLELQEKVNNINPYLTIKEGPKGYYLFDEAHSMCSAHPVSKRDIEMYLKK